MIYFILKEQRKSEGFDSCVWASNLTQIGFKSSIFQPVWPYNLTYDLEKTIVHLFYTTSSFVHHFKLISEFKLDLQSENAQFGSKYNLFNRVTLPFHVWPCKRIWHLFYATSSVVYHFVVICEFELELQSGNAKSGSNSTILIAAWTWNLTDDLEKQ